MQSWPKDMDAFDEATISYVDMRGMPSRKHVLERGFQRAGDDEKLLAFGPVIVECMQTAAELAESTDYGR